ncbi:MAG: glutamyl-tRNA amidotransferase [Cryomorphaceae bacterium BACL21 MAG-121220-bin10]|nr:MAG: glutamyl-tRNA amidotransferase [Cryomorphaceae bacterium BACL21 MAG-121220-bin10]
MNLQDQVMTALKQAMKDKNVVALESLRAIKSGLLLLQSAAAGSDIVSEEEGLKLLQKLVKQRKDSARIFSEQDREDLAQPELDQAAIIEAFLPKPLSEEEVTAIVEQIITEVGATSMKDMGRVMGQANKALAGKAESAFVAQLIKTKLST